MPNFRKDRAKHWQFLLSRYNDEYVSLEKKIAMLKVERKKVAEEKATLCRLRIEYLDNLRFVKGEIADKGKWLSTRSFLNHLDKTLGHVEIELRRRDSLINQLIVQQREVLKKLNKFKSLLKIEVEAEGLRKKMLEEKEGEALNILRFNNSSS